MAEKLKPDKPARVAEALAGYFDKKGIAKRVKQASVISDWPELVGPQIDKVTKPLSIAADGTLFVAVSSAAWMQELQLMAPSIIHQLGKRGRKIKRIVWRAHS
jgi:predicted nucleic acid-binding Zn ribbon protein